VTVKIDREIIVSGGAFESPALLMRSGIGPRDELGRHGIPIVVENSEVGRNLHDRYEVGVISELNDPIVSLQGATFSADPNDPYFQSWRRDGSGLYGTNGSLIAFTARSHPSLLQPNLYIFGLPAAFRGYEEGYSSNITRDPKAFTWAVLVAKTENRAGFVVLSSADPSSEPVVDFQYFQQGAGKDEQALREGVRIVRELNAAMTARPVRRELSPGSQVRGDAQVNDWVRRESWGHHAVGTLALGTVLDSRFRVKGVRNVRVVDASIFPDIPGYFVASSVYIVSEMGAERVLEDADAMLIRP
jgi:choline dehydrogenase